MSATTNDNNNNDKNRPPSERKMKALDIVSSRSLGSLASVQETFAKGRKQRLTGRVVFAVFVGAINDRFGRYKTLWMGMVIFFVGATLQTAANGYEMLMVGRLIAGACIGVLSSVVPVYIAKLAPHHP